MRVLLLQPNYDAHVIHPPLGLGYLASFLRSNNQEVYLFDGTLNNASKKDFLQKIARISPELIGISVLTRGHQRTKEMIKEIKEYFPGLPTVIGGTQVTAAPKEVLGDLGADFAVVGEGEMTLVELVRLLESGETMNKMAEINGLAYRVSDGSIRVNRRRELIKDLDSIPFPAWDLMPPGKYRIVPILEPAKALPVAPIITSRGCPYNCSFCASNVTWGRRIRFRTPENVLKEIKMLKDNFGVKEIHFADDNFTMDTQRAERICDLLLKEGIDLPWQCPNGVRIDKLTPALMKKMRESGCYAVGLGIESGNQKVLDANNKNLDLKIVPKVLEDLRKNKIQSYGFFILGLPRETKQTLSETIDFAFKNSFDRVWFNLFTPYPGSPAFCEWLEDRRFNEIDWDKHDCSTAVVKIEGLRKKEIEKIQRRALLKFYLKPNRFIKLLSHLGWGEIKSLMMTRFFRKILKPLFLVVHKVGRRSTIIA